MSYFGVTIEKIDKIWPIEGADRIEAASVAGMSFAFVIGKGQYKVNDYCLYIPVDALLPDNVAEKLGVLGKLSGSKKNRVKSRSFKKQISQGLVAPLSILGELAPGSIWPHARPTKEEKEEEGIRICEALKIVKWEPEEIACKGGNARHLISQLSKYDIEGTERNPEILELLMDQIVVISEKIEGQNSNVAYVPEENIIYVSSRAQTIIPLEGSSNTENENVFWKSARHAGILDCIKNISQDFGNQFIAIYSEQCGPGVQGNYYELKNHQLFTFDIKVGNRWSNWEEFKYIAQKYNLKTVPIISEGRTLKEFLNGRTIVEASNELQSSVIVKKAEGLVIKPVIEQHIDKFGRLLLKNRSPIYLDKTEN